MTKGKLKKFIIFYMFTYNILLEEHVQGIYNNKFLH